MDHFSNVFPQKQRMNLWLMLRPFMFTSGFSAHLAGCLETSSFSNLPEGQGHFVFASNTNEMLHKVIYYSSCTLNSKMDSLQLTKSWSR